MASATEHLLLDVGARTYVIRVLAVLFIPIGTAMVPASFWILTSLTALDGNLEPLAARATLSALVFVTGLLMSLGLSIYISIYPLKITQTGYNVRITTTRALFNVTREYDAKVFGGGARHEGGGIIG